MNTLPNHTALKEWSSVVGALGRGEQVILIRKGGIADASFGVEAGRFYLYPTYFHQGEAEARPSVTITHWCEVIRTWLVDDVDQLERLASVVVLPRETLSARYSFRPDQALFAIGVRTFELAQPADVPFHEAYAGCRSWVSVDDEIDIEGSRAVLGEETLQERIREVESLLADSERAAVSTTGHRQPTTDN